MIAILSALAVVLFGAALGRRLLRLARFPIDSLALRISVAAGLGLGVLSVAIMIIGLSGGLCSGAVRVGFLIAACLLVPDAALLVLAAVRSARAAWPPRLAAFEWFLVAVILASGVLGLVSALAPPTSWDATISHLKLPLIYLERGRIDRLDDIHSNGPMNGVMLFIPAMLLGGDTAPAVLHLGFLLLTGLAVFGFARRHVGRAGSLLAAAICLLMPIAAALGPEALVDFPVVFYLTLAFVGFVRGWRQDRLGWSLLGAVCLGLALGTKYNALYALPALLLGLVVRVGRGRGRRHRLLTEAAGVLVVAAAVGCPWYVRNVVLTGNPVYPIFARAIPTRHLSAGLTGEVPIRRPARPYPRDPVNVVLYPLNYTLGFSHGLAAGPQPGGARQSPGPLLLALVPLLLVVRPVPGWALAAVCFAAVGFGLIVPTFPLPRYLLPFVVPCAAAAGYVFERLGGRAWLRRVLCAVVTVVLLVQLVPFLGRAATRGPVVFGAESRAAYLRRADDVYPMAEFVARELGPDARLLYVGERIYHFKALGVDATMGMPIRQAAVDFPAMASPRQLLDRLHRLGYTHVVINRANLGRRYPPALDLIDALAARDKLVETKQIKHLVLYQVAPIQ
ncbi:MAG: glycosyltransferase family 39 protein [Planctomycetota bacterium]